MTSLSRSSAILLVVLCQLAAQSPTPATTLRIGTWNLEFLGADGNFRNNLPPRDDADLRRIGEKVSSLGVGVLAVQEVCGEAPLRKVAAGAGPSWQFVLGTTGGWDDGKTSQQIGFLYDAAVVDLLFAEELLSVPRKAQDVPIFHRVPVTAVFRVKSTGFDFRAVTVHLKAGQKAQDATKRRLEATVLHGLFAELEQEPGEDQDLVLLGDFNSSYGSEPEAILETGALLTYLEPRTPTPTIMHFAEPIDQIVVGPGFAELRADSFRVHGDYGGLDKDAWRKIYSDHFPVTAEIDASIDADPSATFRRGPADHALPASLRPPVAGAPREAPPWPFVAGQTVALTTAGGTWEGKLLRDVPQDGSGWVVLELKGKTITIACAQVLSMWPN